MKTLALTLFLGLFSLIGIAQNQYHMSQFMLHQPFINPAAQASYQTLNGALFYKTQWTGFIGAPKIAGFNINKALGQTKNNSLGFTLVNDQIGVNNTNDLSLNYAYRIKTGAASYLSLGLGASVMLMQSNLGEVHTITSDDPVFSGNTQTFVMPNFKFGAYFFKDKFYVGFTSPNLLKNRITFGTELEGSTEFDFANVHFYLHSGYQFELKEDLDLMTSVIFKNVSGAPLQVGFNAQLVFNKKFGIGGSYRTSNEATVLANYQLIPELRLGYAYDYNFDQIGDYSSGTHEIMLIYNLVNQSQIPIIEVPRF
ncbi:MAG: type IX secretion system membrane protein PorP/SprF [Flavobacteriales bacterium]|nr:type IX secretion system membrane protein PorP/SprF [Flavobacteriales bacterium]